jgi:hypothetical protein
MIQTNPPSTFAKQHTAAKLGDYDKGSLNLGAKPKEK